MVYFIDENICIACGACENECPENAISQLADSYVINPDLCSGCGSCTAVCPVEAPRPQN